VEYPTFADGYQMMRVLEKVLESAQKGAWVKIDPVAAEAKA